MEKKTYKYRLQNIIRQLPWVYNTIHTAIVSRLPEFNYQQVNEEIERFKRLCEKEFGGDEVYNSSKVLSILEKWEETVVNHNKIFNVENGIKNHSIRMLEIRCAVKRGRVFKRTENVDVSKAKELSLYVDSVVELRNWLLEKVGNCPVKRLLINGMCNSIKLK